MLVIVLWLLGCIVQLLCLQCFYNLVLWFLLDSVTILYFAKEEANCRFIPSYPEVYILVSIPFQKGLGQIFHQPSGTGIDLGFFALNDLSEPSPEKDVYPLVIW